MWAVFVVMSFVFAHGVEQMRLVEGAVGVARWAVAATMRSCASGSAFAVGGRPPVASAT
jgi:hypothetical protein